MLLLEIRSPDCCWRSLIGKMQLLAREHEQDCCCDQNAANYPKCPVAQRCRRSSVSRPCRFGDPISAGKQIYQHNRNLPYLFRKRTARAGDPQEQSGQLLDCILLGQTCESTSFVPGIEAKLGERRNRTQWNTVSLLSDHGKEERIEIGTQRREERPESHRHGKFPKPAMVDQVPQEVLIDCRDPAPRSGCRPYPHLTPEGHQRSSTSEKAQRVHPSPSLQCIFETG